jgi:hypothetical protein
LEVQRPDFLKTSYLKYKEREVGFLVGKTITEGTESSRGHREGKNSG